MTVEQVPTFEEKDLPVLNKQLKGLDSNKWEVIQLAANPSDLPQRTLAVVDTGRLYLKQADGTLIYFSKDG